MRKVLLLVAGASALASVVAIVIVVLGLNEFLSCKPALEIIEGLTLNPPFVYEGTDITVRGEGTFSAIKAYTFSQGKLSPGDALEAIQRALLSWGYVLEGAPKLELSPSKDGVDSLGAIFAGEEGTVRVMLVWPESSFAFEDSVVDVGIGFYC